MNCLINKTKIEKGSWSERRIGRTGRERRVDGIGIIGGNEIGLKNELTKNRQLQDSNLRGQSPTDFESVSLTTRTSCLGQILPNTLLQSPATSLKLESIIIVSPFHQYVGKSE